MQEMLDQLELRMVAHKMAVVCSMMTGTWQDYTSLFVDTSHWAHWGSEREVKVTASVDAVCGTAAAAGGSIAGTAGPAEMKSQGWAGSVHCESAAVLKH